MEVQDNLDQLKEAINEIIETVGKAPKKNIRYCPNCGNAREFSEEELYVISTRGAIQCDKCLFVPQWLREPPKEEKE